ncbi:hypothetical protein NLJ89_g6730 [Agrocybe chaxingu]|uniref:Uncharacterized protein n=1 Tax=Agrocybe chaxingu TaxID=84603 RepID=A0A9W8JXR1_9AGAR|nr:hypothetical protein NLJ89_g6730 [Agrocybe chaxingu]
MSSSSRRSTPHKLDTGDERAPFAPDGTAVQATDLIATSCLPVDRLCRGMSPLLSMTTALNSRRHAREARSASASRWRSVALLLGCAVDIDDESVAVHEHLPAPHERQTPAFAAATDAETLLAFSSRKYLVLYGTSSPSITMTKPSLLDATAAAFRSRWHEEPEERNFAGLLVQEYDSARAKSGRESTADSHHKQQSPAARLSLHAEPVPPRFHGANVAPAASSEQWILLT